MDYLLLDTFFENESQESSGHGKFLPYSLCILDQELKRNRFLGRIVINIKELHEVFESDIMPKLVGITCSSFTRFEAIKNIEQARKKWPAALIVAGGPHFSWCAEDSIRHIPGLDVVVRGEGEEIIVRLMQSAKGESDYKTFSGITFRGSDGHPVSQGERLVCSNLPDLSFMDQLYSAEMFKNNPLNPDMPIPSMNICAGRGCPYNCIFCSVNRTRNRMYPVNKVVDKIEEITRKFNIRGVKFWDDSLTIDENYVESLCDEILKRRLDIRWFCDSRANINLDLLERMWAAGCRFISVGLETGSPKIQKNIGKAINNDMIRKFAERCQKVGISCYVFIMGSLPDETLEDLEMTIDICRELSQKYGAIAAGLGLTVVFPGTQLERIARERGIIPADFSWSLPYQDPHAQEYQCEFDKLPIYVEGIPAAYFLEARKRSQANYTLSFGPQKFIKKSIRFLLDKKIPLKEKFLTGKRVFLALLKRLNSSFPAVF